MSDQRRDSNRDLVASPQAHKQRHSKFYFEDRLVTIEIENTLFNVHKYQLMKSEVFTNMFDTAQCDIGEGSSPDKPIILESVSAGDFECLLTVLYAPHFSDDRPAVDASLIIPAFRMASLWNFKDLRAHLLALAEKELEDADKIVFAREFDVPEWLIPAYTSLCQRTAPLSSKEAEKLGAQGVLLIHRIQGEAARNDPEKAVCGSCFHLAPDHQKNNGRAIYGSCGSSCSRCNGKVELPWYYYWSLCDDPSVKSKIEKWVSDGCVFSV